MKYYETLCLINPDLADEDYSDVLTKFSTFIEKNAGVMVKVDEWGKKNLAYKVKKFDKGYYVLLQYCGESHITAELRREFKLDERILKYQTIKLSDSADPEALKGEAEEIGEKISEGADAPENVSSGEEGENGE